jgi:hypothetical protein
MTKTTILSHIRAALSDIRYADRRMIERQISVRQF